MTESPLARVVYGSHQNASADKRIAFAGVPSRLVEVTNLAKRFNGGADGGTLCKSPYNARDAT